MKIIKRKTQQYIPSLRECFVPRPGFGFSSEDFVAGETFTHAQSCRWLLGWSDLGDALLRGIDPHSAIAATILGIDYKTFIHRLKVLKDPVCKAMRQAVKPFTFGKPTGMSSWKLVLGQRAQGPDTPSPRGPSWIDDPDHPGMGKKVRGYKGTRFCILMNGVETCGDVKVTRWGKREKLPPMCRACLECADHLGKAWLNQWSENQPYYNHNQAISEDGMVVTEEMLERWPWLRQVYSVGMQTEPGQVIQHWSGTLRADCNFTTLCNGWFQVLLADITKLAARIVTRECLDRSIKVPTMLFPNSRPSKYAGTTSPLLDSRLIAPFHDELFLEHPLDQIVEGADRTSEVMRDVFAWICPDMAEGVGAEPTIMPRWYKNAEPVYRNAAGEKCKPDALEARLAMWYPKVGPDARA